MHLIRDSHVILHYTNTKCGLNVYDTFFQTPVWIKNAVNPLPHPPPYRGAQLYEIKYDITTRIAGRIFFPPPLFVTGLTRRTRVD